MLYSPVLLGILEWLGVLAIIGMGRHSLNFTNRVCRYFTVAGFPIFILHQSVLVAIGYGILVYAPNLVLSLQFVVITVVSFMATIVIYEIIRRIPFVRGLFGMGFFVKKNG